LKYLSLIHILICCRNEKIWSS